MGFRCYLSVICIVCICVHTLMLTDMKVMHILLYVGSLSFCFRLPTFSMRVFYVLVNGIVSHISLGVVVIFQSNWEKARWKSMFNCVVFDVNGTFWSNIIMRFKAMFLLGENSLNSDMKECEIQTSFIYEHYWVVLFLCRCKHNGV